MIYKSFDVGYRQFNIFSSSHVIFYINSTHTLSYYVNVVIQMTIRWEAARLNPHMWVPEKKIKILYQTLRLSKIELIQKKETKCMKVLWEKNPAGILFVYYDYVQNILFFVLWVQYLPIYNYMKLFIYIFHFWYTTNIIKILGKYDILNSISKINTTKWILNCKKQPLLNEVSVVMGWDTRLVSFDFWI